MTDMTKEERRRYELTLETLRSVEEGRTYTHEQVLAWVEQRKRQRRKRAGL